MVRQSWARVLGKGSGLAPVSTFLCSLILIPNISTCWNFFAEWATCLRYPFETLSIYTILRRGKINEHLEECSTTLII
jgi:hypothetical protein